MHSIVEKLTIKSAKSAFENRNLTTKNNMSLKPKNPAKESINL